MFICISTFALLSFSIEHFIISVANRTKPESKWNYVLGRSISIGRIDHQAESKIQRCRSENNRLIGKIVMLFSRSLTFMLESYHGKNEAIIL